MKKNVNGVDIDLSPDEVLAEQQKEIAWLAQKQKDSVEKYVFDRSTEYPSIQNQLLMIWDSMDSGEIPQSKAFYDAIKAINDKYPKSIV